jgi:hypothetical protein
MLHAFVLVEKIKGFSRGMKEGIASSQRKYTYPGDGERYEEGVNVFLEVIGFHKKKSHL